MPKKKGAVKRVAKKTVKKATKKPAQKRVKKNKVVLKELTVYAELERLRKEMRVPKSQINEYGGFNYRSADDILKAYKKISKGLTHLDIKVDIIKVGVRYYVQAEVVLSLSLAPGEIRAFGFAREAKEKKGMDEAQITGSSSSYAIKYALSNLFLLNDEKDEDTKDNTKAGKNIVFPKKPIDEVKKLVAGIKTTKELTEAYQPYVNDKEATKLFVARQQELVDNN